MFTRAIHIHKPMVKLLGGGGGVPNKFRCFLCKFLKIWMVSDKTITRLLEIIKLSKTHVEIFFFLTIYEIKIYFGIAANYK